MTLTVHMKAMREDTEKGREGGRGSFEQIFPSSPDADIKNVIFDRKRKEREKYY